MITNHSKAKGARSVPAPEGRRPPNDRIENTMSNGQPFDHTNIRSVWEKADRQPGFETFSIDHKGTSINMFEYGRRSLYGWIIEHIVPPSKGGSDDISNLRPLHWKHFTADASDTPAQQSR